MSPARVDVSPTAPTIQPTSAGASRMEIQLE
jgi:hypothetical protein